MIRKAALLIAAGLVLSGCDTVTDLALSSKEAAVKYTVKAVEKACDVDEGVRGEVLDLSNLALASGGSPARIYPAFDCDGDGVPDIE